MGQRQTTATPTPGNSRSLALMLTTTIDEYRQMARKRNVTLVFDNCTPVYTPTFVNMNYNDVHFVVRQLVFEACQNARPHTHVYVTLTCSQPKTHAKRRTRQTPTQKLNVWPDSHQNDIQAFQQALRIRPKPPLHNSTHFYVYVSVETPLVPVCKPNPRTFDIINANNYTRRLKFARKNTHNSTKSPMLKGREMSPDAPWRRFNHYYAITDNPTTRQTCYRALQILQRIAPKSTNRPITLQFFANEATSNATNNVNHMLHQIEVSQQTVGDPTVIVHALTHATQKQQRVTVNDAVEFAQQPEPPVAH